MKLSNYLLKAFREVHKAARLHPICEVVPLALEVIIYSCSGSPVTGTFDAP
jgi:hypothetical protein